MAENRDLLLRNGLDLGDGLRQIAVPGVAQQAAQTHARQAGDLAHDIERLPGVRIDAAAVEPDVHFDQHVEPSSGRDHLLRPLPRHLDVVHDDRETHAIEKSQHTCRIGRVDGIGQPDVIDPGVCKDLGLAELRAAHA